MGVCQRTLAEILCAPHIHRLNVEQKLRDENRGLDDGSFHSLEGHCSFGSLPLIRPCVPKEAVRERDRKGGRCIEPVIFWK